MIIGVILARGGSKRVPRKNVKLIAGRPLIAWTILAAQSSMWIDRLVVSSEDHEILSVAGEYQCEIVLRPKHLASDTADSYGALKHAVRHCDDKDVVVLLQPTSPLRTTADIDRCIEIHMLNEDGFPVASHEGEEPVPNGAVYVGTVGWLRRGGNWDNTMHIVISMPPERSVDINTEEDFDRAERMLAA